MDLALDQVVEAVTSGYDEYDLTPLFHAPLTDVEDILYRQEVMRDLGEPAIADCVRAFGRDMADMRRALAQSAKLYYARQRQAWFLEAAEGYVAAVTAVADGLAGVRPASRGLRAVRDYLRAYTGGPACTALREDIHRLRESLAGVQYSLHVGPGRIDVRRYDGEADYSSAVVQTFAKFQQAAAKSYLSGFSETVEMNHVEAAVVDRVALLFPDVFAALDAFCSTHRDYLDPTICDFDRAAQFYLAYTQHIRPLRQAGLPFCFPSVRPDSKQTSVTDTFDLALAAKLTAAEHAIVRNDIQLTGPERIAVITGPNQGGKTTFARTFGQMHYLARLGLPIPGQSAELFLCDTVFTHFERPENLSDIRGKLEDDLLRVRDILDNATGRSVIILNEIFTSTTFRDALFLGTEVLERLCALDALTVCVTFVDELSRLNDKTVSMVAGVAADDHTTRTFRIDRRPADGRAYALAIAEKYGLGYDRVVESLAAR